MLMAAESCPHTKPADHGLGLTPAFFTPKTFTKVFFFFPKPDTFLLFEDIYSVFLRMKTKRLSEERYRKLLEF